MTRSLDIGRLERAGASILLIEERGALRKLLRRVLEDAGHEVRVVAAVPAGLSMLVASEDPVDVAVVDAAAVDLFAGSTRLEDLADQIRTLRPGCRVIFISEHGNRALPHPDRPWIRHLARPFNLDELVRAVDESLSENRSAHAGGEKA